MEVCCSGTEPQNTGKSVARALYIHSSLHLDALGF